MNDTISQCEFCGMPVPTIKHHIVPRCKGGEKTADTCVCCESFIHGTWTHQQLRDIYNTVDSIKGTEKFQSFLKWRRKQPPTDIFKSSPGKFRDKNKYH